MIRNRAMAALALLFLSACATGPERRIRALAYTGHTLEDATSEAREMVLGMRADALRSAARAARDNGGTDAEVVAAVDGAAERFDSGPLMSALNAAISAKSAYLRAVMLALEEDPDINLASLFPIAMDAIRAYENLRAALGERGERLPAGPQVLGELLSGG